MLELRHPLADLKAAWTARYPQHAMASFDQDDIVVRALLEGTFPQFGGVPLPKVIAFGPTQMQQAAAAMESFRVKLTPTAPIRPMLAGTRLAFERDPAAFFQTSTDESVLKSVAVARKGAVRGRAGPPTAASFGVREAADHASAAADDDAGRDLFEQLARLRSTT